GGEHATAQRDEVGDVEVPRLHQRRARDLEVLQIAAVPRAEQRITVVERNDEADADGVRGATHAASSSPAGGGAPARKATGSSSQQSKQLNQLSGAMRQCCSRR